MSEVEAIIRDLIARYLAGEISTGELTDSLPDPWDLDEAADPVATALAMRVVGSLASYEAGDRTEEDLRAVLLRLLETVQITYAVTPFSTTTAVSMEAQSVQLAPLVVAGT
jgi:hypothetical protein